MDPEVFICHSSADAQTAGGICALLEASGVRCWIAPRDPVPGIPYGQQLVSAIARTTVVLFVFSAEANDSRAVLGELELASNRGKIILPVRIDDVSPSASLEFYVRPIHWFDAATRRFDDVAPELVRHVQGLLGQTAVVPSTPADVPREPHPAHAPRHNLLSALTSFVGRKTEVAEVERSLKESRLVTLCGPGGIGKTCIAMQVGLHQIDAHRDGVWFVDLAPVAGDAFVAKRMAAVFGLLEKQNRPVADSLLSYLKSKDLLIILDNCEHVVTEAARITEMILQACPGVTLLATTRETLGVGGEQRYRVPSLAVPPPELTRTLTAANALEFDAVLLFAERALAADRRFVLNGENAATVANICRRLDGIPLAIELAAARVDVLSVAAIAASLDERFRVLTGGARTALPRQKTLRALIDWSYDLLSEEEHVLFRLLAVFAGSFTLNLATAVCASDADPEVFDLLASLVDKSLVQADFARDEMRYRLLESMRAYAREKLVQHGDLESTTRAHAAAYLKLAENLESAWETMPDTEWKVRAEPELENWRAALAWAFGPDGDSKLGQRLVAALGPTWFTMAPSEGRRWIRAGSDAIDSATPTLVAARLALSDAHLAMLAQQYKAALPEAERALQLFTELGDRQGIAFARMFAGAARGFQGETAEGTALLEAALSEFRRLGWLRAIGAALNYLGCLQVNSGYVAASRSFFSEALDVLTSAGAVRPATHVPLLQAEAEFLAGDALKAVRLVEETLAAERALNDLDALTFPLVNLAAYLVSLDRWDDAILHAREALSLSLDRQITAATIWALHHLAAISALRPYDDVAAALEDRRRAARLIGFVDSRIAELDMRRDFTEQTEYERARAAVEKALGAEAADLMREGGTWSEGLAANEGLLI